MVDPPEFAFEAGQWISVPFGPKVVRAWTIWSSPTHRRTITISVDVAPVASARSGFAPSRRAIPVEFKGPTGGFVFNRADPRRAVFVAEEIGIVAVRAILADLYETGYGRPTILIYWARDPRGSSTTPSSARWPAAIQDSPMSRRCERRPAGWRGETGEAAAAVDRLVHSVDKLVVYVCGGGDTVNAVRDALVKKGMDRKSVKWEKFW